MADILAPEEELIPIEDDLDDLDLEGDSIPEDLFEEPIEESAEDVLAALDPDYAPESGPIHDFEITQADISAARRDIYAPEIKRQTLLSWSNLAAAKRSKKIVRVTISNTFQSEQSVKKPKMPEIYSICLVDGLMQVRIPVLELFWPLPRELRGIEDVKWTPATVERYSKLMLRAARRMHGVEVEVIITKMDDDPNKDIENRLIEGSRAAAIKLQNDMWRPHGNKPAVKTCTKQIVEATIVSVFARSVRLYYQGLDVSTPVEVLTHRAITDCQKYREHNKKELFFKAGEKLRVQLMAVKDVDGVMVGRFSMKPLEEARSFAIKHIIAPKGVRGSNYIHGQITRVMPSNLTNRDGPDAGFLVRIEGWIPDWQVPFVTYSHSPYNFGRNPQQREKVSLAVNRTQPISHDGYVVCTIVNYIGTDESAT